MEKNNIPDDHFIKIIEKLKNFSKLPDNWDKKMALPISNSAITRAIRFLHILNRKGFLKEEKLEYSNIIDIDDYEIDYGSLSINPTPEGGIELEWCCYVSLFGLIIPPEEGQKLYFESGWVNEQIEPLPEYILSEKGYTNEIGKIIEELETSQSGCL